jgi:outer membrane protein
VTVRRVSAFLVACALVPLRLGAQGTTLAPPPVPTVTLSLAEALRLAERNSPILRQSNTALAPARLGVRQAYASFAPSLRVDGGMGYTGTGQSQFGAFFARTSPFITSNFSIGLGWTFDGRTLARPAQAKATLAAANADLVATGNTVATDVTTQFLSALQAQAQVSVSRTQVERNSDFLVLAQARYRVGQANLLDVKQAEVARGTSEVTLLNAEQRAAESKLELYRRIGLDVPDDVTTVALADSFVVTEPTWKRADLTSAAMDANPQLAAFRARERAAEAGVRAAKADYFPTLSANAGWSGFTQQFTDSDLLVGNATRSAQGSLTQCPFANRAIALGVAGGAPQTCAPGTFGLDATGAALQPDQLAAVRDQNSIFPFDFRRQPFQANLRISLPIFDNFSRELRVSQARAEQLNADERTRGRAQQLQADVASRLISVQTAYKTTLVQARNRDAARDQAQLARDRYRIGSGSSLEVTDAQAAVARAEGDYVNAVYNYHIAVAALELAVGRPLR